MPVLRSIHDRGESGVNENSSTRSLGERVAALEAMMHTTIPDIKNHLVHLDECVDEGKKEARERDKESREWEKSWDKKLNIAVGIVVGLIFAAGSGTVSLKTLIEGLGKLLK